MRCMSPSTRARLRRGLLPALPLALVGLAGCVLLPGVRGPVRGAVEPLRISEVVSEGDPARRASLRLVVEGLDADVRGARERALSVYERAIQVDPTNPYAYLALARHHAEGSDPEWALSFLDQADVLFEAQGELAPGVSAHLFGLRGQVLYADGEIDRSAVYLEKAWQLAPEVWGDGHLSADELR
jgi:tetratricopeptide (TPR) repeat protein